MPKSSNLSAAIILSIVGCKQPAPTDGVSAAPSTDAGAGAEAASAVRPTEDVLLAANAKSACDRGEPVACTNLGYMYSAGNAVPVDAVRASGLYKKGCDGGDPHGCTNLGALYEKGKVVPVDDAHAAVLYKQGCDGGDLHGCTNLGFLNAARSTER